MKVASRPTPSSDLSILARLGGITLAGTVLGSILSFALVILVTRGLHASGVGVFFEAVALFTILAATAELGADTGLVRAVSRSRAIGRGADIAVISRVALWPVLALSSVLATAVFVFAPELAHVFIGARFEPEGAAFIRILAPFLPFGAGLAVTLAGTRGFGTMVPAVAIQNLGVSMARLVLVGVVIGAGLGMRTVAWAWAMPLAIGFAAAVRAHHSLTHRDAASTVPAGAPARSPRRLAAEFWRFSAPRGVAGFFQISVIWLDVLLVGAMRSPVEAGIYAAASRSVSVGTLVLGAMALALAPQVSELLSRGDRDRAGHIYQTATTWLLLVASPVYLSLAIFSPFWMRIFGPAFVSGHVALAILSAGMLLLVSTGNNKVVLLMAGGSTWNLASSALALVVNVGANLVLIPRLGITGAAIAWLASIVADNAFTTAVVWRVLRLQPFSRSYVVAVAASVLCIGVVGLAARGTLGPTAPAVALFVLVGGPMYLAYLWRARWALGLHAIRGALAGAAPE